MLSNGVKTADAEWSIDIAPGMGVLDLEELLEAGLHMDSTEAFPEYPDGPLQTSLEKETVEPELLAWLGGESGGMGGLSSSHPLFGVGACAGGCQHDALRPLVYSVSALELLLAVVQVFGACWWMVEWLIESAMRCEDKKIISLVTQATPQPPTPCAHLPTYLRDACTDPALLVMTDLRHGCVQHFALSLGLDYSRSTSTRPSQPAYNGNNRPCRGVASLLALERHGPHDAIPVPRPLVPSHRGGLR